MQIIRKIFQTFFDIIIQNTGIATADSFFKSVELNNFDTIPPEINGSFYNVNNTINRNITDRINEICNNFEISDFNEQLEIIINTLQNVTISTYEKPKYTDLQSGYVVSLFETIGDVCLNSTGSLNNLFQILNNNGFSDIIQNISVNDRINIENCNIQRNIQRQLLLNKAINNFEITDFDLQMSQIINNFTYHKKQFEDGEYFNFEDTEQYNFDK